MRITSSYFLLDYSRFHNSGYDAQVKAYLTTKKIAFFFSYLDELCPGSVIALHHNLVRQHIATQGILQQLNTITEKRLIDIFYLEQNQFHPKKK